LLRELGLAYSKYLGSVHRADSLYIPIYTYQYDKFKSYQYNKPKPLSQVVKGKPHLEKLLHRSNLGCNADF